MEGGDAAHVVVAMHARHGTTSLLATTMTAPPPEVAATLAAIGRACTARRRGAARILGVYLEGPYINAEKLGAQPAYARVAGLAELQELGKLAPLRLPLPLRLVTLAPEIKGHLQLVCALTDAGIRDQIGHTAGTYDDGVAALEHGAAGSTHLFNAMSSLHHREPAWWARRWRTPATPN